MLIFIGFCHFPSLGIYRLFLDSANGISQNLLKGASIYQLIFMELCSNTENMRNDLSLNMS